MECPNSAALPQFPAFLPGKFWGITTFFNPCQYRNKYENYRIFRENSQRQGLNLLVVELVFDNAPFELKNKQDAEILIQLRGTREKNLMWQKERLLNIGLKHLPFDCDKVAWIDCDIIFKNDRWIEETSGFLEKYIVVQPFELSVRLVKGLCDISADDIETLAFGWDDGQKSHSVGCQFSRKSMFSQPGFCWALRRSVIEKHPFYDPMVMGSADTLQAGAYLGIDTALRRWVRNNCSQIILLDYSGWAERIYNDIKGSVYYTEGTLLHLWHGKTRNRIQDYKFNVLSFLSFNPSQDIKIGSSNLWEWSSDKPELHKTVADFFRLRDEEGDNITLTTVILDKLSDTRNELSDTRNELSDTRNKLSDTLTRLSHIEYSRAYKLACILRKIYYAVLPSPQIRQLIISSVLFMWTRIRICLVKTPRSRQ